MATKGKQGDGGEARKEERKRREERRGKGGKGGGVQRETCDLFLPLSFLFIGKVNIIPREGGGTE